MQNSNPLVLWPDRFATKQNATLCDQCDCACPDSRSYLRHDNCAATGLLVQPPLHRQDLGGGWTLLFNPLHDGQVAVLNRTGLQVWEEFATPHAAPTAQETAACIGQMTALGLLVEPGSDPTWQHQEPTALSAWLHLTDRCNLRCTYCYVPKRANDMDEATGRAAVDALVRSAHAHAMHTIKLKYAGGEPTLKWPLICSLHEYAQAQTHTAGLTLEGVVLSNGAAISDRALAALHSHDIQFCISLDGIEAVHDGQRPFASGQGSFTHVVETIERLLARGIKPMISLTISRRNAPHLEATVRFLLARDLPFNLNFVRDTADCGSGTEWKASERALIDGLRHAFAAIEQQLPDRSLLGNLLDRAQFYYPHDRACSAGVAYMAIRPDGRVAKCQMELDRPVAAIWAHDVLAAVREDDQGLHNSSVEQRPVCHSCLWRYWCGGGCPLQLTSHADGTASGSPYCRVYQAIFPDLLRLEGLRLVKLAQQHPLLM